MKESKGLLMLSFLTLSNQRKAFGVDLFLLLFLLLTTSCQTGFFSSSSSNEKDKDGNPISGAGGASGSSSGAGGNSATGGKSRHDLIKEEKRRQSEADLPVRILDPNKKLRSIAFGAGPVMAPATAPSKTTAWNPLLQLNPDLFIFVSPPVNVSNEVLNQPTPQLLQSKISDSYKKLNRQHDYRDLREKVPFLSAWQDISATEAINDSAKAEFLKYWTYLKPSLPKSQKDLFHTKLIGEKKQTVQVLLTHNTTTDTIVAEEKSSIESKQLQASKIKLMSDDQWNWLSTELKKPAGLRLLISPVPVLLSDLSDNPNLQAKDGFVDERERLFRLLRSLKVKNLVILSASAPITTAPPPVVTATTTTPITTAAAVATSVTDSAPNSAASDAAQPPTAVSLLKFNSSISHLEVKGVGTIYEVSVAPINGGEYGYMTVNWETRHLKIDVQDQNKVVQKSTEIPF